MPRIPVLPAKDLLDYLLRYGCRLISVNGSHHPSAGGQARLKILLMVGERRFQYMAIVI